MNREKLEEFLEARKADTLAIGPHLDYLAEMARGLVVVELGVKRGASSAAFLKSCAKLISYDIKTTCQAEQLKLICPEWNFRLMDSVSEEAFQHDLLFIDTVHTLNQVKDELCHWGRWCRKYIIFHDTITFGSIGADGESGKQLWQYKVGESVPHDALGIRPAIDYFMISNPRWKIEASFVYGHGLLVLRAG